FNKFAGGPLGITGQGNTFNTLGGATPVALGPIDKTFGHVTLQGNNILYFGGWTQVPDPSIQNMAPSLRSLSNLFAIQDASGKLLIVNPTPGTTGGLNPNFLRGPGSFRLDVNLIKHTTIHREPQVVLTVRGDATNLLNRPQWANPNTN